MNYNEMTVKFKAISANESFARVCIAAFLSEYNPTIDEIGDIKTAISEAVTNCVVHAYPKGVIGDVEMYVQVNNGEVYISITDNGVGIEDIEQAKQPFYTTKPNSERSGMGFTVMEGFMDTLAIMSTPNKGVKVEMTKKLGEDSKVSFGG